MPGLNGLVVMTPTSIASTGTGNSSSIGANGKVTFSSCATLSLNGVFTSSYDNYVMVFRAVGTALEAVNARLRVSGTDNATASSYVSQYLFANGTSVTADRYPAGTSMYIFPVSATQRSGNVAYFFGPNLTQPTAIRSVTGYGEDGARIFDTGSTHNQSVAYDGITLILASSTMTGAVTVYGFNQ